ncbi:MAG: 4-hydroxythreonine-4-phosphate dehydrogenase PdxA, partial [Deltaproteobacteria bacterium]|nr:4-hydroxythreonine-4-phosphate dehydrogenase PdxA [Deltaproteobacteria bacterium]
MRIGITMGDPKGVGPEIIVKALQKWDLSQECSFVIYGDAALLSSFSWKDYRAELVPVTHGPFELSWDESQCGHASILYLEKAVREAIDHKIDALVTAPICKANLQKAGYDYPGHTEFLAQKTQTDRYVMMMASPQLKVSLVTIHVPLKEVPTLLEPQSIFDTVQITYEALKTYWGLENPKVAVCGLNPHAGEKGVIGEEEVQIIEPALQKLRDQGYSVEGPVVPDAVFYQANQGLYDAVVCMYHDQGLIPFKMLHFQDGVNVTLGLPIIRTSPDHGV